MADWQKFREVGTSRVVSARPMNGDWQIKRGLIRRKVTAEAFEKKYERA